MISVFYKATEYHGEMVWNFPFVLFETLIEFYKEPDRTSPWKVGVAIIDVIFQ